MKFIFNISCTNTHNQNKYILTKKNKQKTIIISNFKFYTKYKRKKKKKTLFVEKNIKLYLLNKPLTLWTASTSNPAMNMVMTDAM